MPLFSGQSLGGQWRKWVIGSLKDLFTRANTTTGLGTAPTGQVWAATRGNWFISSNKATSNDTPSTYPLASAQVGLTYPTITEAVDNRGGPGIAFWVTDSNNWWGFYAQTNTSSSASTVCTTYSPAYTSVCTYGTYSTAYGCSVYGTRTVCGSYTAQTYCTQYSFGYRCTQFGPVTYCSAYTQAFRCQSGFYYTYYSKSQGGTVTGFACSLFVSYNQCTTYSTTTACVQYGGTQTCSQYGTRYVCDGYYYTQTYCVQGYSYQTCSPSYYQQLYYTCSVYGQQTTYSAGTSYARIVKSVGGTISTVVEQAIASLPSSLKLILTNAGIIGRVYSDSLTTTQIGSDITATPSGTATTTHGILLAPGGYYQGNTVSSLSAGN